MSARSTAGASRERHPMDAVFSCRLPGRHPPADHRAARGIPAAVDGQLVVRARCQTMTQCLRELPDWTQRAGRGRARCWLVTSQLPTESGCMRALSKSASMHKHMHKHCASMHKHMHKHQADAGKRRQRRAGERKKQRNPQKNPRILWITCKKMHKHCTSIAWQMPSRTRTRI